MSTLSHQSMTNNHGFGLFAELSESLHVWRERRRMRHELTQWSARDLHDVGLSWSDIAHEAGKPFWRA